MKYRIAIVGSGTAGPAAGIFLAKAGHEVTLFERAPCELAVGAGFLLQPTGLAVLEELGLADAVLAATRKIERLYCHRGGEKVLLDLDYRELREDLFGLGTHRPTLLRILLQALEGAGAEVRWNTEILKLRETEKEVQLWAKDKKTAEKFDLVLVCDGARSTLRQQCGMPAKVSRYPWGAAWFIGKRTPEFSPDVLWQAVGSTRELCGFLPTGTEQDLLSLFWSVRLDQPITSLSTFKEKLLVLEPRAENFLKQLESVDQLQSAAYHDVRMKQWHTRRVVILGDAAHALSPQLGQGVNLALVDAMTLAGCLEKEPLDQALNSYSTKRKKHVGFYQFATRWTTPFFQSDHVLLGGIRDLTFPIAMKLPILRRQMVATMAGLKTGPFSSRSV